MKYLTFVALLLSCVIISGCVTKPKHKPVPAVMYYINTKALTASQISNMPYLPTVDTGHSSGIPINMIEGGN